MKESLGRITKKIRENTPKARRRRRIEKENKEDRETYKLIFERAEEAKKHILTISFRDYAESQGKSPSDYLMQQLSTHAGGPSEEGCVAESLGKMLDKMEQGKFEAVVDSRLNINRDSSFIPLGPTVKVIATGTALKLKEDSEKQ